MSAGVRRGVPRIPTMSKTITTLHVVDLQVPAEGLRLASGEYLPAVQVAYEAYGELNQTRDNAIYICHALTGDAHAAFYNDESDTEPGWWDPIIGPGKPIDTDRYFVVCANILGGCKGTTGPGSTDPRTGKLYGADFPLVTIKDVVNVQKRLLEQLGVPGLYCVIGGSMGGMQALEWSVAHPDFVRKCICIASAANLSPQALAFDIVGRQEIESDPDWRDGRYYEKDTTPAKGLSRARQIGHITYLSSKSMNSKFGREQKEDTESIQPSKFSTNFQVESYLNYQGNKFVKRFDANSYLYISRMMDMFDLVNEYGSMAAAFERSKCHYLLISISSDWLFPMAQMLEIVSALIENRKEVSYFQLNSQSGHDAFLIEYDVLGKGVEAFLHDEVFERLPESVNRMDFDLISGMIDDGTHILDVGSGGGELMWALRAMKQISGICIDLDFDKICECMHKGLPAIQLDAETGLELIPDDAFDGVLLNQTIQQLRSALQSIKQVIRIAAAGVVGFPNFAYYPYRFELFLKGQLPVSRSLPYEWYNTPNIHLVTIKDFRELCRRHDIVIGEIEYVSENLFGKILIAFGFVNLGSERSLVKICRPNPNT